jgi:hypothetical protein
MKVKDYRFKLVFNFTEDQSLESHFLRLAAFKAVNLEKLKKEADLPNDASLSDILKKVLLHAG